MKSGSDNFLFRGKTLLILISLFVLNGLFAQEQLLKNISERIRKDINDANYDSVNVQTDVLIKEAEAAKSNHYLIYALAMKASALSHQNHTKEAVDFYFKALKLCDSSEDKQRVFIYNGLGILNYTQNNFNTAKNYFCQEIELRRKMKDSIALASCLINLSSIYNSLKLYDSSLYLLQEIRQVLDLDKHKEVAGYYYLNAGTNYQMKGELDSAIENYTRSMNIWFMSANKKEALKPLFNIGNALKDKGKYKEALPYYIKAMEMAERLNLLYEKKHLYGSLALIYDVLKDYKPASFYYSKYVRLTDSLQEEETKEYVLEIDKLYHQEQSRNLIHEQKLAIAEKEARISEQKKQLYLALFLIVLTLSIAGVVLIYFNFQKRLTKKIDETKQKFFSNVVHEIRTPLTMIQAPLRVLKTKLAAGEDLENVVLAERNVDRLKELVNQMLDISKIESSKYSLNETLGDIELFLRQLIHLYEHTAKEKNVSILFRCSCPLKTVLFDKDAIEKITGNLLSNAIKYTPAGGQVGLDAESEETEQGVRLMINVWDTGPGIPQQDHKKIFSRFYRSSLTASSAKGVGIGLSLAKDLVDLHKGTIQLKSSSDAGSVFSVCLDLRLPEEKLVPVQAAVKEGAELLLVEDNLEILNFNSRLLEQHQFTVLKARNGKEALSLLEKTLPDLIITDVMMPEMDGAEFLRCLKSNVGTDHIPVIVLSAKASAESRMNMMVLGAQAYLPKPFLPEELIALVNNQLEILSLRKDEFKNIAEVRTQRPEEKFVGKEPYTQKLIQIIFQRLDDPDLSVESLAENMATNRSHFQRKVKALTGYSPSELIKNIRLEKAKEFLLLRKGNITEAAYYTGFSSQSYFTKCFVQHFGIPPTQMLQEMKNPS